MLCSVIIPLYNKEQFVELAIHSVLNQTHQEFEIVVVDDGSTDNGVERVLAFHDPRIRVIRQKNGGVSRARNRGIDEARGELVCFLDADDWYEKSFLQTIRRMARQYPRGTFFGANFKTVYEYRPDQWNDLPALPRPVELVNNFYERRYRLGAFLHTDSVAAWRADLLAMQPCYPPGESMGEDQDFWHRMAERFALAYCAQPLIGYRYEVQDGLCSSHKNSVLAPVYARLEQRALQGVIKNRERRYALLVVADARVSVARHLIRNGRRFEALPELLKAWRGVVKKRWWTTLMLWGLGSPSMMARWEKRGFKKLNIQ